jgi:hypothetical protein
LKKGLFIICEHKINSIIDETSGILKKINAQINALNIPNKITCQLIELPSTKKRYVFNLYKNILNNETDLDFVYIRRIVPVNKALIILLNKIRANNPQCKILYELPTFPYDNEDKRIIGRIITIIDRHYRMKLKSIIDRIVTLSIDNIIFGLPTIKIKNGICCRNIPIKEEKLCTNKSELHLVAVANFAFWHGYDRLIEGIKNYYEEKKGKKIFLHFVGDGDELIKYKRLAKKYNLLNYCKFHGLLSGDNLTNIYNQCDIGVCSLGNHRKKIYISSELKSREYLARGLLIVTAAKIDIIPDGFNYFLKIAEDESPVNINEIINFYEKLLRYYSEKEIIYNIRDFAKNNCDISQTMLPVIDYISESNNYE